MTPRFEYRVTKITFANDPDVKKEQESCDAMAVDGWRLVTGVAVGSQGGPLVRGSVSLFWERLVQQ